MKTRILLSAAVVLLLASILVSCSDDNHAPVVANPTIPKFLIAVDGSGAGTNVNVFPVNATTGVLGAAVSGSPFDLGLTNGMTLAVHPNGRFVYAADGNDGSIHAWSVSETTGVPTQIAVPVINESGSYYQPANAGDSATHVITLRPTGAFSIAPTMTLPWAPIKSTPMDLSRTSQTSISGRVTPAPSPPMTATCGSPIPAATVARGTFGR